MRVIHAFLVLFTSLLVSVSIQGTWILWQVAENRLFHYKTFIIGQYALLPCSQIDLLKTVSRKQEKAIQQLQQKFDDEEMKQTRANLIVSGIPEEEGENTMQVAKDFFRIKMEISDEVPIVNDHY